MRYLDLSACSAGSLARTFAAARPWPHVVLEDVLRVSPEDLLGTFPDQEWDGWHRYRDYYQHNKLMCSDLERIPGPLRELIWEMNSPTFLEFVESVTGEKKLIVDPYLTGGGLHASGTGGILSPHTDFHLYPRLGLYRKVNVLLYLNPGWTVEDGGCLELWEKDEPTPARVVNPAWGTMVMFRTDDDSVHGFSNPIAKEGAVRRSVALYYYGAEENASYAGDRTTYWREHGEHGAAGRARLAGYKALLGGSRVLAAAAHRLNPNMLRLREATRASPDEGSQPSRPNQDRGRRGGPDSPRA